MKESFVFYHEWAEAIKDLPNKDRLEIYEAIISYSETGEIKKLSGTAKVAFGFIKPQIDRNAGKYEAKVERMAKARSKNPNNNQTNISQKSDSNQTNISSDNVNVNDNDNVNDNVNENVNVNGNGGGNGNVHDAETAAAPTLNEIKLFFQIIGSKADPKRFFEYYGPEALSNMDWRAKAKEWKETEYNRTPKVNSFEQHDYSDDEMKKQIKAQKLKMFEKKGESV